MTAPTPIPALFYDTETTGLPLWNFPSEDPDQPHIVELSAILATRDGPIAPPLYAIIKPDGWTIPPAMTAIHGISHERALAEGIPESDAVARLLELWQQAEYRVAHNENFDARIVRIALKRYAPALADRWTAGKAYCTADLSTPLCALPPTEKMIAAGRGNQYKRPTLAEAHRHFFGGELENAHNAMADAEACWRIFLAILKWRNGA